jgi:hypothetical protein
MKLHATESVALVEIWAGIKNYVPAKDQRDCATQFIATIEDAGLVDLSIASAELYGVCETFDQALRIYCQENGYDEEGFDEDWDE